MSDIFKAGSFRFDLSGRNLVMGVLNVTPDSFSDGGLYLDTDAAVRHGRIMAASGADIIDVGGESTRPGARPVDVEEQIRRVIPVIEALAKELSIPISIDTTKSTVAQAALGGGASIINDITGFRGDPGIARLAAESGAGLILMHMRGTPETMQQNTEYGDLFGEILFELQAAVGRTQTAGVDAEQIVVDPGIGFAKTAEQNMRIISNLEFLRPVGRPILIGVSRKSFLGAITGRTAPERLAETIAATIVAAQNGARIHRVHDVAEVKCALAVLESLCTPSSPASK